MKVSEIVTEAKRKHKRSRWAAYGPGPYGGYGYAVGYSGDGGEGGGDGVGEQTSQSSVSKDDPYNPKKVRPLKDISDDEIRQWLTPDAPSKPDQSKQTQSGQGATKVREASYPGNIGVMEVYKFLKLATPEQVKIFKKLIDDKQFKTAWALIQGVTGIKLQGKEFDEDLVTELKIKDRDVKRIIKDRLAINAETGIDAMKLAIDRMSNIPKTSYVQSQASQLMMLYKQAKMSIGGEYYRKLNKLIEDFAGGNKNTLLDALQDFLPFIIQELRLKSLPKIKLRKHIPDEDQPTFGRFENDSRIINLGIQDRHPIDILRTLAHELVHYKQLLKNGLNKGSGETGSYDENQANVLAGIIMRKFNKKFPKYFDSSAINFNENFADGHNLHEKVQDYLWHGSREEHDVLYPRQAVDTGGAEGSNKNAVYATPNAKVAIAMGLTTPGSDTGMFPDDPQMVLFKGEIRKGEYVYLHKVPKDLFIKHNSREWYSKPDVKEITPIEIKAIPVNKWLHLIRQATPQDLELQKKYMKENFADGRNPQDKGDSRRHGIPKGATIAQLKKIRGSKTASPRKKQLAHWQINMRQGRKK